MMDTILFIGGGIILTLELLFGSMLFALMAGTLLAVVRHQGRWRFLIDGWISLLRGTPLILQLSFVYFACSSMIGIKLDLLTAGILTFGCHSSAYVAEILRGGIESLPRGQFEAAESLRIPRRFIWKDIILPQVFRNVFPALVNETITLLKESSLIATIGGLDLMRRSQQVAAEDFSYFLPLLIAGAYYYTIASLIARLGTIIERKISYATPSRLLKNHS